MDEETRQKMINEILDQIKAILFKEEHDYNNDSEIIANLLKEAKEKGLIQ